MRARLWRPPARRKSCRVSRPTSSPGSSSPTTPHAVCAIISACWRSTAAAWTIARLPPARPRRFSTTCAKRSAPRSIIWSGPSFYDRADALVLDATTVRNLELVEPLFAGESKDATLLSVLDRTRTGMGGRLLRRRLLAPSLDTTEIDARLDAVEELHAAAILRAELAKDLAGDSRSGTAAVENQPGLRRARAILLRWPARWPSSRR